MNLKEIMQTNPKTLAELQHRELKKHTLQILSIITDLIESENYNEIENYLFESPAGDGYGMDSSCIDFNYGVNDIGMDIEEIVGRLQVLKKQVK